MQQNIVLTVDASTLDECVKELLSDLTDAPGEVRERALDFLNAPSELVSVESGIASGAMVPLLFKPSQRLLDLCAAVRARNFDGIIV